MKNLAYIIICIFLFVTSCSHFEASDNGDLDGSWYLTKIDTLANGHQQDYRQERVFWSIQGTLLQMHKTDRYNQYYMSDFERSGQTLSLPTTYKYDRLNGAEFITDENLDKVRPFGLNRVDEHFSIEKLDRKKMILESEMLRLEFERF